MPGLESDVRAGATRISPSELVAKAADMTPAVSLLSDAFRKGSISAQDFIDRYDQRGQARAAGETAQFQLLQKQSEKAMDPRLLDLQQKASIVGLEGMLAQQNLEAAGREEKYKLEQMKVARALDEMKSGLPAVMVQEYALKYPEIVKPVYDDMSRVQNVEEVRKQLSIAVKAQKSMDALMDLDKLTEKREFERADGSKEERVFWRGLQTQVSPEILQASAAAKQSMFGRPGQVTAAPPPAAATPTAATTTQAAAAVTAPPAQTTFEVGQTTPEGGMITKASGTREAKYTEVESRANKFAERMTLSEQQYTDLLQSGFDPASVKAQTQLDALNMASKVPLAGPSISAAIPEPVKRYDAIVKSFTSGMLRDESGAAIRDEEREEYERMFFPRAGDSPEVIQNKAQQRASAIAALRQVSSRQMTPQDYERYITEITGKQFPAKTSVANESAAPAGALPSVPVLNKQGQPAATPASIPRFQKITQVPPDVKVFQLEGENRPRRR
jgi:hypothetical protein